MASATATADSKALMGFSGFSSLNFLRQIGLMLGLAASVAVGFAVVLWSQEAEYRPLYDQQHNLDAASIIGVLDSNQIQYKMEPSSGMILVDASKLHDARMKLSASGITGSSTVGLELLDKEQTLGTSQFVENARYRRGLEGELARTISSIQAVRNARVHLAIPKSSVFLRDRKRPRASVFLELYGSRNIGGQQVKAIRNMVASAIPEMKAADVSVVDQNGNLLSSQERASDFEMAAKQLEYADTVEVGIKERVSSILTPIVGAGNFKTEVTANLDFTEVEQTDEKYNPEQASVRSEQSLEEVNGNAGDLLGGIPGALANQPPEDAEVVADPRPAMDRQAAAEAAASSSQRKQSVRNYEIDRTISHTKHQFGKMQRLSVAVVIDNTYSVDPETQETVSTPWTPEQLQQLTQLVKDTVGFDEARGDSVNVMNSAFVKTEPLPEPEAMAFYQQPWFESLVKQVLAALFVLVLVFAVLRPILNKLAAQGPAGGAAVPAMAGGAGAAAMAGAAAADSAANPAAATSGTTEALLAEAASNDPHMLKAGGEVAALPGLDGSFEQQMDTIRNLIQEDPNRVAQVVRKWVADSE